MTTPKSHSVTDQDPVESRLVQLRGRPIRLEGHRYGWSANVVERGYFPVSCTGYRSFATGCAGAEPPSLDALESLAVQFDSERAKALKVARDCLAARFAEPLAEGGEDGTIGRHIRLDMAAQRALEQGSFAPANERVALWEAAFLLFDRLARDPLVRPHPNGLAWTKSVCERAVQRSLGTRDVLARYMAGDFFMPEIGVPLFALTRLRDLMGDVYPAQPLPCLDLVSFPAPLTAGAEMRDADEEEEPGDRDELEDGAQDDEAEATHDASASKSVSEQLSLF